MGGAGQAVSADPVLHRHGNLVDQLPGMRADDVAIQQRPALRIGDDLHHAPRRHPPIYDPKFLPASQAGLRDDELALGVAWGGAP